MDIPIISTVFDRIEKLLLNVTNVKVTVVKPTYSMGVLKAEAVEFELGGKKEKQPLFTTEQIGMAIKE